MQTLLLAVFTNHTSTVAMGGGRGVAFEVDVYLFIARDNYSPLGIYTKKIRYTLTHIRTYSLLADGYLYLPP